MTEHHSGCDECREITHEVFMRRRNCTTVIIDPSLKFLFKDEHLELFEINLATAYVAGELNEDDRGWIEAHLRTCARGLNKMQSRQ